MTTIRYTITLISDGVEATASSQDLEFVPVPAEQLQAVAEHQAQILARGHVAGMEMAAHQKRPRGTMPPLAPAPIRAARRIR